MGRYKHSSQAVAKVNRDLESMGSRVRNEVLCREGRFSVVQYGGGKKKDMRKCENEAVRIWASRGENQVSKSPIARSQKLC